MIISSDPNSNITGIETMCENLFVFHESSDLSYVVQVTNVVTRILQKSRVTVKKISRVTKYPAFAQRFKFRTYFSLSIV